MPFASVALIGAAAGVAGAYMQSESAEDAANAQAGAADRSSELARQTSREQMDLQRDQFGRQEALTREQMARDRQIYDEAIARNEQGRQAGLRGLTGYENKINQGFQYDPNAFSTDRIMNDPGMQFRQQTGENALRRQINAGNGVYSGAAAKELTRFNSNLASQEYGAAYGRAADGEARRKDAYQLNANQLASLAGIGQTANSASQVAGQQYGAAGQNSTNALGQAGQAMTNGSANALGTYGQQASSNIIGAGNAMAGNSMYQGNTWANALNQGASAWGRRNNGGGGGYDIGNTWRGWQGSNGAGSMGGGGSVQGNSDYYWDV